MKIIASNTPWLEFETWEEIVNKIELKSFEHPKNDAEKLFNAQKRFILSKFTDKEAETELFQISELVCKRLIKKELIKRHYTFYSLDDIQDKAGLATLYWIRRYKNYWNEHQQIYYIKDGFIVALWNACQYALDYVGRNDALDKFKKLENEKVRGGLELTPDELEEHERAFRDVEECIELLYAEEKEKEQNEK